VRAPTGGVSELPRQGVLVLMAGLPGAGKSTLARHLAGALGAVVLDKDVIRAALFPPSEIVYSTEQDDFCMGVMLDTAEYLFRSRPNRYVILDGRTFSRTYQRDACAAAACRWGVAFKVIECVCSRESARARLGRDVRQGRHVAANRDFALYLSVADRYESISQPKLVVDTDQDIASCVVAALRYVTGTSARGV